MIWNCRVANLNIEKYFYIMANTLFRQAFLLSEYSFICKQYAIYFWQLVNETADCFNNIVFILVENISSKKVCEKIENNSTLEKVLLVCIRNAELLRLVEAIFDSKVASLRRMRRKNLIILKSLPKKRSFLFYLFGVWTFELSNINWRCSENCNMLTERTYDSDVFKIFLNFITICGFIEQ